MSFHERASDVSRLNLEASRKPVCVDQRTRAVIRQALEISAASGGCFDVSVAAELVGWGFLPSPTPQCWPDPLASWRDIELLDDGRIRFHRPLWVDLGGIAKGFAVDEALARMALGSDVSVYINAGGDLRVAGPEEQNVRLAAPAEDDDTVPLIRLRDGSIASSGGPQAPTRVHGSDDIGPHVDGSRRSALRPQRFVSVLAPQCMIADALTKIVMARGTGSDPVLRHFQATALMHDLDHGWRRLGTDP